MSETGRHRRRQPSRLSRASVAVTASGAGAALPLLAATGAAAAAQESWSTSEECAAPGTESACPGAREDAREAPESRAAADRKTSPRRDGTDDRGSATSIARPASYRVVSGDTLSGIAESEDVAGGWQGLYAGNRRTIGRDPDLILPGQRLVLRGEDGHRRTADAPAGTAPSRTKPQPTADPTQQPESAGKRSAAPPPAAARNDGEQRERGSGARADRAPSTDVTAPVSGLAPSTPYRSSGASWSSGHHTGVDFPVSTGTAVKAMASGRVVTAGWGGAYGYQVVIRHPDGKYSQYGHLSALSVRAGQSVNGGQRIGRSGSTGNSTGPHLHFEVRTGPEYGSDIDPLAYLRVHGVDI